MRPVNCLYAQSHLPFTTDLATVFPTDAGITKQIITASEAVTPFTTGTAAKAFFESLVGISPEEWVAIQDTATFDDLSLAEAICSFASTSAYSHQEMVDRRLAFDEEGTKQTLKSFHGVTKLFSGESEKKMPAVIGWVMKIGDTEAEAESSS